MPSNALSFHIFIIILYHFFFHIISIKFIKSLSHYSLNNHQLLIRIYICVYRCNKLWRLTKLIDQLIIVQRTLRKRYATWWALLLLLEIFDSDISTTSMDTMTNKSVISKESFDSLCDYSLQLNRWLLKPIGAWPSSSSSSKLERIVSFFLILLCYGFILFTVIPCLFHIVLEDENLHMKLKVFGPLSHWFIGGINYTTLLLQNKEIRYCIEHMQTDWKIVNRAKDQEIMMRYAKIGRYIAALCAVFMQSGVLTYCVVTAFSTQIIKIGNETRIIHMLPCAVYKELISIDTSPTNEIVLISQFVSGFIVNSIAVGAISIGAVFAAHACGQLTIITRWIREYINRSKDNNKNVVINEIGEIVEYHLRILR